LGNSSQLFFLGTPCYHGSSEVTPLPPGNFSWLLAYLAVQDDWVDRKDLAELLWQDADLQGGLNNLRQLLHRHKSLPWAGVLEVNAQALRIASETDVRRFRGAFSRADWRAALQEYGGALLEGVRPLGVEAFETWLESERSILQSDWREALIGRTQRLAEQSDAFEESFALLEKLLEVDPYNEEALVSLLRAAQRLARRDLGLQHFQMFKQRLRADLGVEPLPETLQAADVLAGKLETVRNANPDSLLGRETEQATLLEQLALQELRLLNVRGTGGVGKTVLAKRVFELAAPRFADGAFWVSLQPVLKLADVPLAIAAALEFNLNLNTDVWLQVGELLGFRNTLLVLDNCEHLPGLPERIADLLEATRHLKILVTSRVSLELPNENIVALEGLDYPNEPILELLQTSNAVRLFVVRAAVRKAGFALTEHNKTAIWRICQLVQGLPLGLALAAAWVSELSPEALRDGLESNADVVALEGESLAHQSLRMVFEHSWELLEDDLRTALSSLSVFRGGFERRAALEGLGIAARALLALVGRSLLQSLPGGRYDLHPTVQVFAAQKLEPARHKTLQLAHARYFMGFAESSERPILGGANQLRMLERVSADHQNFLAVSDNNADPDLVLRTVAAFGRYYHTRDHMLEGLQRLETALAQAQTKESTLLARAELAAGIQGNFLADFTNSDAHLKAAMRHAERAKLPLLKAEILNWQGANSLSQGMLQIARMQLEEAIAIQRQANDTLGLINSVNDLGRVFSDENDTETAKGLFEESLGYARACQDLHGESIALSNFANMQLDSALAKSLIAQSMEIKKRLGDLGGLAFGLHNYGSELIEERDYHSARRYLLEALEIRVRVGRKQNATHTLLALAQPDVMEGHFERAMIFYGVAWATTERINAKFSDDYTSWVKSLERQARDALGETVAQKAFQRGWAMSLEEAARFAQSDVAKLETATI
jgi:predicted ATPase/DNA-binding SARP family transcriptional activator